MRRYRYRGVRFDARNAQFYSDYDFTRKMMFESSKEMKAALYKMERAIEKMSKWNYPPMVNWVKFAKDRLEKAKSAWHGVDWARADLGVQRELIDWDD